MRQVTHSIYLGDTVNVGEFLELIEAHDIPNSADVDWEGDKRAMILSWLD